MTKSSKLKISRRMSLHTERMFPFFAEIQGAFILIFCETL